MNPKASIESDTLISGQITPGPTNNISNQFKISLENMKDLYNPNNNTINLAKLSLALKLETPLRDGNGSQSYIRGRSSSIVEDNALLNEIINLTL